MDLYSAINVRVGLIIALNSSRVVSCPPTIDAATGPLPGAVQQDRASAVEVHKLK